MTLAKKTLKPKSNQYEEMKVPTWAEWEEINKTLNELDATKSVKKAKPPKGNHKGKASNSPTNYEMPDIYKHNKDNVGSKYSSSVKKNSPPQGKGYGKVDNVDDYKKSPYKSVKESINYIDKQYQLQTLLEEEDEENKEESDSKEMKGDQGDMDFDFGNSQEDEENQEEKDDNEGSSEFNLKVSSDYIHKLLSDKASKIKTDTVEVSEVDNSESEKSTDSFDFEGDSTEGFSDLFSSEEDNENDDELKESFLYEEDEEKEEKFSEDDNESKDNFDFSSELSDDEDEEAFDSSDNVVQKFEVSFETKNLTKSDKGEKKDLSIEIVEVDDNDSVYKAVLKDGDLELESDSKKCTSSSNVEALVKEVINKFFNSSSSDVSESKKMKKEGKEKFVENLNELEEDLENLDEEDDLENLEEDDELYDEEYDDIDDYEEYEDEDFEDEDDIDDYEEYEDDIDDYEEYDDEDFEDEEFLEESEEYAVDENGEIGYAIEDDVEDEDFEELEEEYDNENTNKNLKVENKFFEFSGKLGISKEDANKLYQLFNEALESAISKRRKKIYKEAINYLSDKVNKYLNYVVESWVRENKVAIVENLEYRKMKRVMNNLMNVLAESNIIVDKKELKLAPIYENKIKSLKNENRKLLSENMSLKEKEREIKENLSKASIFLEETVGLSEVSKNKIRKVLANTKFINESQYRNKIREIKKEVLVESKPTKQKFEPLPQKEPLLENIEYPGTTNVSVNNSDIKNVISLSKMLDNFVPKY